MSTDLLSSVNKGNKPLAARSLCNTDAHPTENIGAYLCQVALKIDDAVNLNVNF